MFGNFSQTLFFICISCISIDVRLLNHRSIQFVILKFWFIIFCLFFCIYSTSLPDNNSISSCVINHSVLRLHHVKSSIVLA